MQLAPGDRALRLSPAMQVVVKTICGCSLLTQIDGRQSNCAAGLGPLGVTFNSVEELCGQDNQRRLEKALTKVLEALWFLLARLALPEHLSPLTVARLGGCLGGRGRVVLPLPKPHWQRMRRRR